MSNPNQPRAKDGKFTHSLVESLEGQLRQKGHPQLAAHQLAIEILTNQGSLDAAGNLTAHGRERERMGREGRAKDRLAAQTGHNPAHLVYDKRQRKAFVK